MSFFERPRIFLDTKTTNSTDYVDIVKIQISKDAKGVNYFILAIDPDPNALYQILISHLLEVTDLELTAIWQLVLPHLPDGRVYTGFKSGDRIIIRHKSRDATITVKTGFTMQFIEVV